MEASARDRVVVLMVDDQAMFGEAVRRMLAEDNEEQMEKLRRKRPRPEIRPVSKPDTVPQAVLCGAQCASHLSMLAHDCG